MEGAGRGGGGGDKLRDKESRRNGTKIAPCQVWPRCVVVAVSYDAVTD